MTATNSTPKWLLDTEVGLCPCACIGTRKKGTFVEKTISSTSHVLRRAMFSDDMAARRGLLQTIEPRVKLVTLLGVLVAAALVRTIPILILVYLASLVVAVVSGLSPAFFVKRVWLFIPICTGIVVLPATFSFITPGDIVVPFGTWFGRSVGMTTQGLTSAGLIVTRVAVSISLVVLLTVTTPWNRLLGALRALHVPRLVILVLAMAYRYVFLLLNSVTDMYTARKARTVDAGTDVTSARAFVAASAGALFGKSQALAEEVHMAMLSRGFTGDARSLAPSRVRARDAAWTIACLVAVVSMLGVDRALGR